MTTTGYKERDEPLNWARKCNFHFASSGIDWLELEERTRGKAE
jgi:hypothetical protein